MRTAGLCASHGLLSCLFVWVIYTFPSFAMLDAKVRIDMEIQQ